MQDLGAVPKGNFLSQEARVSGDGSIVVVDGEGTVGARIWTAAGGMRDLKTALVEEHGLSLTGWTLYDVWISSNGRVLVGNGRNPRADPEVWRAVLASPPR